MNNVIGWKQLGFKDKLSYVLCITSFIIGVVLTTIGMFVSPIGEIHASVLTSLGVFLTFSGSIIGISQHYSQQLENFKVEIRAQQNNTKNETDVS